MKAFIKKEILEQLRSGKLMVLGLLFVLLGIMNPGIAKLTPWLMAQMADSLSQSGITVSPVSVSALDAWTQFYKNIPMGLIAFVLLESAVFTREYQTGTLLLSLTKGLARPKVVMAKAGVLSGLWTLGCFLCAGVTYGYSAYYWDNAAAQNLVFSVACYWVFGLWITALTVFFSAAAKQNTGVLAGVGGVVLACFLLSMLPRLEGFLPTRLTDGNSLILGLAERSAFTAPLVIALAAIPVLFAAGVFLFNRKQL